ncbi:hypothetical protein EDC04DRAFT_332668 [Pisolithus marmoratus]|nr:hypothetical protein EDC04DRAFT_332668 [Pisolithus marmoratus]
MAVQDGHAALSMIMLYGIYFLTLACAHRPSWTASGAEDLCGKTALAGVYIDLFFLVFPCSSSRRLSTRDISTTARPALSQIRVLALLEESFPTLFFVLPSLLSFRRYRPLTGERPCRANFGLSWDWICWQMKDDRWSCCTTYGHRNPSRGARAHIARSSRLLGTRSYSKSFGDRGTASPSSSLSVQPPTPSRAFPETVEGVFRVFEHPETLSSAPCALVPEPQTHVVRPSRIPRLVAPRREPPTASCALAGPPSKTGFSPRCCQPVPGDSRALRNSIVKLFGLPLSAIDKWIYLLFAFIIAFLFNTGLKIVVYLFFGVPYPFPLFQVQSPFNAFVSPLLSQVLALLDMFCIS